MKSICSKIPISEEGKLLFKGDKYVRIMVCCVTDTIMMAYGSVKDNLTLILKIGVLLVYYYIYFVRNDILVLFTIHNL